MRRKIRFTILCNEPEKQQLAELADRLGRTQGETIRWAIRCLASDLRTVVTTSGQREAKTP